MPGRLLRQLGDECDVVHAVHGGELCGIGRRRQLLYVRRRLDRRHDSRRNYLLALRCAVLRDEHGPDLMQHVPRRLLCRRVDECDGLHAVHGGGLCGIGRRRRLLFMSGGLHRRHDSGREHLHRLRGWKVLGFDLRCDFLHRLRRWLLPSGWTGRYDCVYGMPRGHVQRRRGREHRHLLHGDRHGC
jgi:hypothetical protein